MPDRLLRNAASIAAFLFVLAATSLLALEVPPAPTQWFTDRAGLIDAGSAEALNQKLRAFEQESGAQVIVYVLPSLEGDPVEDFTIRAAEKWKVGQKKYDNGLILFVFVAEKKIRVEVGYGLEGSITDAYSSRVIREHIAPRFAQGDWAGGLNAGVDALMQKIRTGEEAVPPMRRDGGGAQGTGGFDPIFLLIIVLIFIFFLGPLLRRQGCSGCIFPFIFPGGGGITFGGRGGGFGGGFGGGGFSGGGGGFGGGGATGGW